MIGTRTCDRKLISGDWEGNLTTSFRDRHEIKVKSVRRVCFVVEERHPQRQTWQPKRSICPTCQGET